MNNLKYSAASDPRNLNSGFADRRDADGVAVQLEQLSRDLGCLTARLGLQVIGRTERAPYEIFDTVGASEKAQLVRALIKIRRTRESCFRDGLFADPAWDILLDLYLAQLEQRRTSVTDLCIAAEVPSTTALRWIKTLSDKELLTRAPDPLDKRRTYVDLSADASVTMSACVGAIAAVLSQVPGINGESGTAPMAHQA